MQIDEDEIAADVDVNGNIITKEKKANSEYKSKPTKIRAVVDKMLFNYDNIVIV